MYFAYIYRLLWVWGLKFSEWNVMNFFKVMQTKEVSVLGECTKG